MPKAYLYKYCVYYYIIFELDIIFRHFYLPNDKWCNKFKTNFGRNQYFSENDNSWRANTRIIEINRKIFITI